jgi:hypothetical protein
MNVYQNHSNANLLIMSFCEPISKKSQTDWQRLDAMNDEDIDLSDCPEVTPEQFAKAVVRRGLPTVTKKEQVTLEGG